MSTGSKITSSRYHHSEQWLREVPEIAPIAGELFHAIDLNCKHWLILHQSGEWRWSSFRESFLNFKKMTSTNKHQFALNRCQCKWFVNELFECKSHCRHFGVVADLRDYFRSCKRFEFSSGFKLLTYRF